MNGLFFQDVMKRLWSIPFPRWLDGLWLALLMAYILAGVCDVPLHGDESTQLYMARDFYYLIVEHDFAQLTYRDWDTLDGDAATQQDLRLKDGVLHRYLFGAAAYLSGYAIHDLNGQWVWGAGWDWNHENGHVPDDTLLYRARLVSATMLALGAIVLFCIAQHSGGRGSAYIATLLYATSPALLLNGRRAMMEGAMTLFSLLVVLAGLWVLQSRKWWAYALLGVFSGLAVASKHTAVVTVIAVFAACVTVFAFRALKGGTVYKGAMHCAPTDEVNFSSHSSVKHCVSTIALFAAGLLSLVVFYILNPAWWSNPIARAAEVSQMRLDFMQAQETTFGGYDNFGERAAGFFWQIFGNQNMYAETDIDNFREHLAGNISAYEASPFSGFINRGSVVWPVIFALLTIMGFIALCLDATTAIEAHWLIGVWCAATIALTLLLTPVEWQRYYLPAYPAVMLLTGFGVRQVVSAIRHRFM